MYFIRKNRGNSDDNLKKKKKKKKKRGYSNMASIEVNKPRSPPAQRRNLIIEGLEGDSDDEIKTAMIKATTAMGVTIYACEIEQVIRMRRRDDTNPKPGPVLATMTRSILCDNILSKKGDLLGLKDFDN